MRISGSRSGDYEDFYLLGYKAVQSVEVASSACYLLHAGFLLWLFFGPEDGGHMFFQNVG
jgi:hypothetical protein